MAARAPRWGLGDHHLGPRSGEPGGGLFWDCVREPEPRLVRAFSAWDEITTPPALAELFAGAGIRHASVQATHGEHHPVARPEDFWDVVLGSGYRATVDALGDEQREALRERLLDTLRSHAVTSLRTDVVFATANAAAG